MRLVSRIRSLVRRLFRRSEAEHDLDEELRAYVDELSDEYRRRGLSDEDARRAASLDLGGMDRVKESVRDAWTGEWLHTFVRDLRYSVRALAGSPGFTAVATLTLALGLGGATAVFSVMDAVLFRPPPGIAQAERVVAINRVTDGVMRDGLSYPEFEELRAGAGTFSAIAAHVVAPMRVRNADGSRRNIVVDFASGSYFELLGVLPAVGRLFGENDADPADPHAVLVLSHDFWSSQFGNHPGVIGQTVEITGTAYTVVGVAAPDFEGTMTGQRVEAWAPLPMMVATGVTNQDFTADRSRRFLSLVGRLNRGATVATAREALTARGFGVAPAFGRYPELRRRDERFFRVVGTAVALLLLLACANVAALCLLRASSRQHEFAARLALGASRVRLARRLLVEGALLTTAATIIGAAAADLFVNRTMLLATPLMGEVAFGVDLRVLAFSVVAATGTVLLVSILPVLRLGHVAPMAVLRAATAGGGRPVSNAQRGLVITQVAVSFALVATASTIFRDVRRLLQSDLGFDARNVAMVYVDLRTYGYDEERTEEIIRALSIAANGSPSIVSATVATAAPLLGRGSTTTLRDEEAPEPAPGAIDPDRDADPEPRALRVGYAAVQPSYFSVLGIPVQAGRSFVVEDGPETERVAVVTRALARRMWGSTDPLGRYVRVTSRPGDSAERLRVVGVVADHKHSSLWETDQPVLYVAISQVPPDGTLLIARGRLSEPSPATLRDLLRDVDPELYPDGEWTTEELMANWTLSQRTASFSIGLFGLVAVLLSALGVYGAVGHLVGQRTRELAVRSVLGAGPWHLTALAMREGVLLGAVGLLLGGFLLHWTQTVAERSLDGITGLDPLAVLACLVGLATAVAASSYLPARRAKRIGLVEVLRQE